MPLYRARVALALGTRTLARGTLIREGTLSERGKEALLRRGALLAVGVPPLAVLPGWGHRARRLATLGIADAEQALEAFASRPDELASHLGVSPGLLARWEAELLYWLTPLEERHG